ncbi:DMT family transporter [Oceanicola sp. D3]|uniref:DMT family transporter n=1 Tax=Oceanicola sp. D3 TaxID=2587163 RepID=UPI001124C07A|nr:DMT family transporter [Oceanicola sp. D3]QDC10889.1 DMT family transporter [Oceanicola sp. D3]
MRLALLIALTMAAFAANSLLNRAAVDSGRIDPLGFALLRVASGAAMLWLVLALRGKGRGLSLRSVPWAGALSLAAYMLGFSLAYLTLGAGLGALILFGVVQITMFSVAALRGAPLGPQRLAGAGLAFAGLAWLLWPGGSLSVDLTGAALMVAAGVGWGVYTLAGKGAADPLSATAANFLWCLPLMVLALIFALPGWPAPGGVVLAVIAGAVTSGLGYALWYALLPRVETTTAAVVQLSVPVIALAAGALLLGEALSLALMLASAVVLGGIALVVTAPAAPAGRSQSRG